MDKRGEKHMPRRELSKRDVSLIKPPEWAIKNDEENTNGKFLNHELAIMQYATKHLVDFTVYDSVLDACSFYMGECANADIKPNIVGLCATLRIRKEMLYKFASGESRCDPEVRELLNQMLTIMEYTLNLAITDSKQNPVGAIFLLKNQHKYSDKTEYTIDAKNNGIEELSDKQLREKYMGNVIIDDEDTGE